MGVLSIFLFSFFFFSLLYIRKEGKDGGCGNQIGIGLTGLELEKARTNYPSIYPYLRVKRIEERVG